MKKFFVIVSLLFALTANAQINNISGLSTATTVTGTSATLTACSTTIANNAGLVTLTLPSSPLVGDWYYVIGQGAGGWLVAQNASQKITYRGISTTVGVTGSIASTYYSDAVTLVFIGSNEFILTEISSTVKTDLGTYFSAGWTIAKVTGSDFTTVSAALVPITGLSFTAAASTTYEIDAWLDCVTTADANGMQFGINSSGTSPTVLWQVSGHLTSTTVGWSGNNSNNTACATAYLTASSQEGFIHIWGIVKSGTGNPLITLRILKVGGGTATVKVGSKLNYRIQ